MDKPFKDKCITCGSEEIEFDIMDIGIDGTTLVQEVTCKDCDTKFEIYSATNWVYEEVEEVN